MTNSKLSFACDYMKGAHPSIIRRQPETNMLETAGYGLDPVCEAARERIRTALREKDYELFFASPTNQIFCIMENEKLERFGEVVEYGFWENYDDDHTVIRISTDWATEPEKVDRLLEVL